VSFSTATLVLANGLFGYSSISSSLNPAPDLNASLIKRNHSVETIIATKNLKIFVFPELKN